MTYLVIAACIGNPEISLSIDCGTVGENKQACTELIKQIAVVIVLQDRRLRTPLAGNFRSSGGLRK